LCQLAGFAPLFPQGAVSEAAVIDKFIFGVFFGGVTVAGGLVAASLVTPVLQGAPNATVAAPPVEAPIPAGPAKEVPADQNAAVQPEVAAAKVEPVATTAPKPVVDPMVEAAVAAPETAPPSTETPTAKVPATAALVDTEIAAIEPEVAAKPDPASAVIAPDEGAVATLQPDTGTAPADAAEQAPASEPVTVVEEAAVEVAPVAPLVTEAAPPATPEPVDADVAAAALAEVPAPDVPQGPAQPQVPAQDAAIAAIDTPVAVAPKAEAEPSVMPAPEVEVVIVEPDPAPPAAEPEAKIEAARLPGSEAAKMPGSKPAALPGAGGAEATLPEAQVVESEVAIVPGAEDQPGSTLKPEPGLRDKTDGVIIGRLPKIGDAPATEATPAVDPAVVAVEDSRPIVQFAASFENPGGKPVFAIVLIDTGAATLDRAALANLPFAVSFALDPLDPATPERSAIYRAAGKEVVMLATGIVAGAQASDVEVAFQAMAQGLPEAVAVMDLPEQRFQDNRPLASLVVPVVASQGRGLLTWDQGLNAADQVARREDLAASVVFRPIDAAGEDDTAIRRGLDRAAFKAAQDGRVTVVGRASPETVAALLEWTVEGRAATVALAPLTAVMTVD
jgi:uncharacterized protein